MISRIRKRSIADQLTIHCLLMRRSSTPPECPFRTLVTNSGPALMGPPFPLRLDRLIEFSNGRRSQARTVQSLLPDTMKPMSSRLSLLEPSLLQSNFKHRTLPAWPRSVARSLPVWISQILMLLSRDPVTILSASNSKQYTL